MLILIQENIWLAFSNLRHLILEFSALFLESEAGVFFPAHNSLELCQVFAVGELVLEFLVALLVNIEFPLDTLQQVTPFLFQEVAFLQAVPDLSFVFLGVSHNLRFPLIVYFNLKLSLPRPLGSKVLVKFVN